MINYWWVTRPKRNLSPVPSVLSTIVSTAYHKEWSGARETHLVLEESFEQRGLKRVGERRDQTGGGARTYVAWLKSLGLLFTKGKRLELTLAGQAIFNGENPYPIISNQVLKYQFPSSYSISRGVNVSERFHIHPFIFLLRLLRDNRVNYLTQEEIAKIVIVEAENNSDKCFEYIVNRIKQFRDYGDECLESDFAVKYAPSKGGRTGDKFGHLLDTANTFINWLDYTRLISRETSLIKAAKDKIDIIDDILAQPRHLLNNYDDQESYQRAYGLDPAHKKDLRTLSSYAVAISTKVMKESLVKNAFISEAAKSPITAISHDLIVNIADSTGLTETEVSDIVSQKFPNTDGLLGGFLANYREMAFSSKEKATEFEIATTKIFKDIFGFTSKHVGPIGLTPDVLVLSDSERYVGIIDNKAYRDYSISNDHRNRMIHNYIENIKTYYSGEFPLAFFSYIAGGFSSRIDSQISSITDETSIHGSAIKVDYLIKMIENQPTRNYTHEELRHIFSVGRQIQYSDIR